MDGRKYLSGTICLRGEDGTEATFEEIQKFGEGAACISYEARKNGGNPGVLKEFYPHPTYDAHAFLALNRQENGQLLPSRDPDDGDFCAYFRKVQQDFEDCHRTLQKKRREERNKDLDKFLPAFELYRGYSADRGADGTTYIWFPGASARVEVTFEDFCKSIQERPREKPGYKLAVAVRAVLSLTKCVMALHAAGLIHRDIKPENFGFMELQKEILTQIPSLFDMDSICSVKSRPKEIIRSVGYTEPEAEVTDQGLYAPRVETDIYSIVASLFHAIIITPETKESGYLYQEKYAGRWQDLVNASDLIQATETNSLPRLRALLARILEKGLCRRRSQDGRPLRYESCEELISDLEKAYSYIVPAEWEKSLQDGQKWFLQELDPDRQKNSTLAIQYHLYEHPLYQYCKQREAAINILIVGFDNCGQRFLDACLQAGQGCGHALHATVLWDQKEVDQKIYLDSRPALGEFFNIDGKGCSNRGESYGWIDFRGSALGGKDSAVHRRAIEKTLRQCRRTFHYVFIDLGTDSLNLAAAEAAAEQMPEAFISYVCEGTSSTVRKEGMLCPVLVREPMEGTALHREIERMAFNVHLVWEKSWNRDDQAVKEEFKEQIGRAHV